MIRRAQHTLKFATSAKKQKLKDFFAEYARLVNAFITLYWNAKELPPKATSEIYSQVDSWLMGKARKCAVNQAVKIVKSTRKKNIQKTYSVYQRAYSKAKKLNRNVFGILGSKWAVWAKGKTFRHRLSMPVFSGNTIELNSDLVRIQTAKSSVLFDLWIRLGSIFGNRFSLVLPTKHHKRSRMFESQGWVQSSSVALRRDVCGQYYVDLFWEKEEPKAVQGSRAIGVDLGIQKLMACSNGLQLGTGLRPLLDKLNRRKQESHNWFQTCAEIKDYIGRVTNEFPWAKVDVVVMEDLLNITKDTVGKVSEELRKLHGHWNLRLVYRRMADKSEENRVFLAFVEPAYSSQRCFSCGEIHEKSRVGERFKCVVCGHADDADHNASLNILRLFLDGQFTVARGTKSHAWA